jgi:hypothetical protein
VPIKTTKPLTADQRLAYQLVVAVKKLIDPGLGFRDIRFTLGADGAPPPVVYFQVPAQADPAEARSLRVEVRHQEVRLDFRCGKRVKRVTLDASAPEFEREAAEFIGKHWNCYFSTYWMSL